MGCHSSKQTIKNQQSKIKKGISFNLEAQPIEDAKKYNHHQYTKNYKKTLNEDLKQSHISTKQTEESEENNFQNEKECYLANQYDIYRDDNKKRSIVIQKALRYIASKVPKYKITRKFLLMRKGVKKFRGYTMENPPPFLNKSINQSYLMKKRKLFLQKFSQVIE